MPFSEARAHLDALGIDAMKSMAPSLHRMQALMDALDHPELKVPAIHITGTNGKTSVAKIASSLLGASGLKVGTYTSPHLVSMTERVALNGVSISNEEFGDAFDHLATYLEVVEGRLGERLTYFEVMTALFFLWAADTPVDVAVIEVGLGGRWDATNVVEAPVAVITNIGLDHTSLLGDRPSTAAEKSGIIKRDASVVTAELDPAMLEIIGGNASRCDATMITFGRDFSLGDNKVAFGGRYLSVETRDRTYGGLFLPLHGAHQAVNAATALQAVDAFLPEGSLSDEVVAEGFGAVVARGRLETVRTGREDGIPVVLDVAHNPDGLAALVKALAEAFAFERVVFVVGILSDKDHAGMIAELTRLPSAVIFTQPAFARSESPEKLQQIANELGCPSALEPDVAKAVDAAFAEAAPRDLICVTGSHYVVGEARSHLLPS